VSYIDIAIGEGEECFKKCGKIHRRGVVTRKKQHYGRGCGGLPRRVERSFAREGGTVLKEGRDY